MNLTKIKKINFIPEKNGPRPFEGWVPENCPQIEGEFYFNATYMNHPDGWIGRSIEGFFFFYPFIGEVKLI